MSRLLVSPENFPGFCVLIHPNALAQLFLNRLANRHPVENFPQGWTLPTAGKKKTARGGLRSGACVSARRVHEWHQGLGGGHAQAQRCPWVIHQRQQPLQRAISLRQAMYQAGSVAAAYGPSSAFPASSVSCHLLKLD